MKKDNNNIFKLNKQKTEQISKKDYSSLINNPSLKLYKNDLNEKQEIKNENEPNEAELEQKIENSEASIESNEQSLNGESKYRQGRWTEEEHRNFLKGIIEYGNDWKMVEKIVKTRTSSQSRSHAQKYFLKFKNLVEYYKLNEKSLYEVINGQYSLSFFFDKQFIQLNSEEKKKLLDTFITNINLFSESKNKRRKKSIDKNKNKNIITTDDYNKIFKIESKDDDNKSFHSDEDDDNDNDKDNISSLNDKNILNKKTKRNKIFNIVKCTKYKYSEEFKNNLDNKNKNIKFKFFVQKNKAEKNSNNKGNNNKNNSKMNNNLIINNKIININNTNNLDVNVLNIFNYNINTININNINYINNTNESNKNIFENSEKNILDNNNNFLTFSQKYLSYDFLRNSNNNNLNLFENDEEDELSSLSNNKNKTIFVSPL